MSKPSMLIPDATFTKASSHALVSYATAHSILGLCSGLSEIDLVIGGLKQGMVVMLTGTDIRLRAAERYCIRAQLPKKMGGLESSAFFIDGGNAFDVYLLASVAREYGLDIGVALERVLISRAFTPYELRQLVCKDSTNVFRASRPGILIVSDIFQLFGDELDKEEAKTIMQKIGDALDSISEIYHNPILLTSASIPTHLTTFVEERCNIVLDIIENSSNTTIRLTKHPSRGPFETLKESHHCLYNQQILER